MKTAAFLCGVSYVLVYFFTLEIKVQKLERGRVSFFYEIHLWEMELRLEPHGVKDTHDLDPSSKIQCKCRLTVARWQSQ